MASEKLEIDVVADASKAQSELKDLTKTVEQLEKSEPEIEVTADDKASPVLEKVAEKAKELRVGTEVTVQGKVDSVIADLDKVAAKARETAIVADALGVALGPELAAKADTTAVIGELQRLGLTLDDIGGNTDELGAKLKELADADVGGKLGASLGTARGKTDEMADSARGANSALANMVGNTAQDLGAVSGVVGSLGVGIGQMAEYAADAAFGGEKLGSALVSMAKVAGPMAALAAASYLVSQAMGVAAAKEELVKQQTDSLVTSLLKGKTASEGFVDALVAAGKVEAPGFAAWGTEVLGLSDATHDYTGTLVDLGLGIDSFNALVDGGTDAIKAWGAEQIAAGARAGDVLTAMRLMTGAVETEGAAADAAADKQAFFGDKLEENTGQIEKNRAAAKETADALSEWTDGLADHIVKVGQASQELEDMDSALSQISGRKDALAQVFELDAGPRDFRGNLRDITEGIKGLDEVAKGVKVGDVLANNIKADKFLDAIDSLAPQIQSAITDTFGTSGPEAAIAMANSYIDQVTKELGGKFSRGQVAEMLGLSNIEATIEAAVNQASIDKARRKLELLTGITGESPWTATIELALDAGELSPDAAQAVIDAALRGQGVAVPINPEISDAEFEEARQWIRDHPGTMPINGDIKPVIQDSDEARAHAGETATMPIDGDPTGANNDSDNARARASGRATMPIDGDPSGVNNDSDNARARASGKAVMPIAGDTKQVDDDSDNARARASGKAAVMPIDGDTTAFDNDVARARKNAAQTLTIPVMFRTGSFAKGGTVGPEGGIAGEAGKEFAELPDGRVVLLQSETPVPPGTKVTSARKTRQILQRRPPRYANGTATSASLLAPVVNVSSPPIVVKLDGRPIAALIGSTTAPAVRAAAMSIRAGRA